MYLRSFISTVGLSALIATAGLPSPGNAPLLRESPLARCGENWGIYAKDYDTNPDSPRAMLREMGVYEMQPDGETPRFLAPIAVLTMDDEGVVLLHTDKGVMTQLEQMKEYLADLCTMPGALPTSERG